MTYAIYALAEIETLLRKYDLEVDYKIVGGNWRLNVYKDKRFIFSWILKSIEDQIRVFENKKIPHSDFFAPITGNWGYQRGVIFLNWEVPEEVQRFRKTIEREIRYERAGYEWQIRCERAASKRTGNA